jgi:hypothetical protein
MVFVTVHLEMLVKFENQATRSGISYNTLAPKPLVSCRVFAGAHHARYQVSRPFVDWQAKGSGDVSSLYTVEI